MSVEILSKLKTEFDDAQKFLKDVDENIKRITGRDPTEIRQTPRRNYGGPEFRARDRPFPQFDFPGEIQELPRRGRGSFTPRGGSRLRRTRAELDEESPEEDIPRKVTVQSSVVATLKAVKTRKDTIETQKGDRRGMERNRRMFGMILGTLQKFQSEESKRKEQAQKRAEIEQKLELAADEEREKLRKERQGLFLARREKQAQIRRLEQKLEIAQLHDEWEASQKLLLHFILTPTVTCSPIAYRPKKHTPESQKKLQESQKRIQENIDKQRKIFEDQLAEIDELYCKEGLDDTFEDMEDEPVPISKCLDKENLGPTLSEIIEPKVKDKDTVVDLETIPMEVAAILPESTPPHEIPLSKDEIELPAEEKPVDTIGDQEFEPIYD